MTTYLQMNGTSDYLKLPSMSFDRIVFDMEWDNNNATEFIIRGTTQTNYLIYNSVSYQNGLGYFGYSYGGHTYLNGTEITQSSSIPYSSRITLDANTSSSGITDIFNIFADDKAQRWSKGNLYDIKIYKSGVLIAHYDMSTGTVNDQTGNGHNATLYGGTWVGGTPSGTTYIGSGLSQGQSSLTPNETLILSSRGTSQGTSSTTSNETLISNTGTTYSASAISQGVSSSLSNDKLIVSASAVSQGQSSATSSETTIGHATTTYSASATSQGSSSASSNERVIYEVKGVSQSVSSDVSSETVRYFVTGISLGESSAISNEQFISVQQIISHVTLQGSRELHVILKGQRDLHVVLKGGVDVPAENQNFTLEAGTDKIIDIPNIVDSIAPLDLTSCLEIHYEAKRGNNIISKDLTNGITVTSPTDLSIALIPADTHGFSGSFHHEVWCIDSNNKRTVILEGSLTIKPSYADVPS